MTPTTTPTTNPARAILLLLFAACGNFVCSVRKFCLEREILLLAVSKLFYSFFLVCSVRQFCLQRVILLLVMCTLFTVGFFFVCSVREFCLQCAYFFSFFFVCSVLELIFSTCSLCLQGFFLFAVFSLC